MSENITRIFKTHDDAVGVVSELESHGYAPHLVSGLGPDGTALSHEAIVSAITGFYILKSEAEVYAPLVAGGGTLVSVHAPFGTALRATRILESKPTIATGLQVAKPLELMVWDDATPLSCTIQMPVLAEHDSTFSAPWNGGGLLTADGAPGSWFGLPLLLKGGPSFGGELLSNAAPLSSLFKIPTLI
jgi:hypothetical protein